MADQGIKKIVAKPRLKRAEPVWEMADPFADDKLDRMLFLSKALNAVIADADEPLVIALNGGWGVGKTFFLDRWAASLHTKDKGCPRIIFYNAWQDDDLDDPLLTLVGQLHQSLHASPDRSEFKLSPNLETKEQALFKRSCPSVLDT